jgi:hydroxymethylbilane synthase
LKKLVGGDGDGLVVAKAALDRLLSGDATDEVRREVRLALNGCAWTVLPLREFPTAAAQGALAIEVAANRPDMIELVREISHDPTRAAVEAERAILASQGGGCREAMGTSVLIRDYGVVTSVRGRLADGPAYERWSLETQTSPPPRTSQDAVWPRPDERRAATRRPLPVNLPGDTDGLFVARADALPAGSSLRGSELVWAAGAQTWSKLAARGVWVHGCTDGLGDTEAPSIDLLAGHSVSWLRLTHTGSSAADAFATYVVAHFVPDDFASRTHFFWPSGSLFLEMLVRYPEIRRGWHASGPGRTFQVIRETLGAGPRVSIWLDHDHWYRSVTL